MTTWTPDTDDCEIEISDEPATRGQIVGWAKDRSGKIMRPSGVHGTAADVLAENQRKNRVMSDAETAYPSDELTWSIAPSDRAVEVRFVDDNRISPRNKRDLEDSLVATYGMGKVRVI